MKVVVNYSTHPLKRCDFLDGLYFSEEKIIIVFYFDSFQYESKTVYPVYNSHNLFFKSLNFGKFSYSIEEKWKLYLIVNFFVIRNEPT